MMGPSLDGIALYAILDTMYVAPDHWRTVAESLIHGGADMVEVRAKGITHRERRVLMEAVAPLFEDTDIPLIVNDDLELALAFPDVGLHLGQDDTPIHEAREALGEERILGLSTHSLAQAKAASAEERLTYFCVGPIYTTGTKPEYDAVGLDLVRDVARMRPERPWFAIGGVNRTTLPDVLEAGAKRVVVVSDILQADDPAAVIRELKEEMA